MNISSQVSTSGKPRFRSKHRRQASGRRASVQLSCEALESRQLLDAGSMGGMGNTGDMGGSMGSVMDAENQAVLNLVPLSAVTNTAVNSGNWTDPNTWSNHVLPGANANVEIPQGVTVTFNASSTPALRTLRDDGTLTFSTLQSTSLLVDTMIVTMTGDFVMGTPTNPIPANIQARVTFADRGPIDLNWDPNQYSRGLISMGMASICGAQTTPYEALAQTPLAGNTTLVLAQVPTNWNVGDQLVLTGTSSTQDQDEQLTILGISGNQVTVRPLTYNHVAPAGQSVYVADLTRNVVFASQNATDITRHGCVMFMHTDMETVSYAGFYNLGRTDKTQPIDDPRFDANGNLIPGSGQNPRGRYALHFHHDGTDPSQPPIVVTGCVVTNSPGWGYVNHGSDVDFEDNVSFNVVGAGFVAESGDEIGTFNANLAIRDTGDPGHHESGLDFRLNVNDFGYSGHGFWLQSPGITVTNNIAVGAADSGFFYDTLGYVQPGLGLTMFDADNLQDPALADGMSSVPVGDVPVRTFSGNVAFASWEGLNVWNQLLNAAPGVRSVFQNFTTWNDTHAGVNVYNSANITLSNINILGTPGLQQLYGFDSGGLAQGIVYDNDTVVNTQTGIHMPIRGTNVVTGGYYDNLTNVLTTTGPNGNLDVQIDPNVQFGQLTGDHGGVRASTNLSVLTTPVTWDLTQYFTYQGTVLYQGQQVYSLAQDPNYVFFKPGQTPSFVPPQLIGKTNQQLWNQYGLAIGGALAPPGSQTDPKVQGLLGSVTTPSNIQLLSPDATTKLQGYQLVYSDANGNRVVDPTPVNLQPGWNLLTRTVNGILHTFLVYGDVTTPTVTFDAGTLLVNPADVGKTILFGVTVTDQTGTWHTNLPISNLANLPVQMAPNGSMYVVVNTYYYDRMGAARWNLTFQVTIDPTAPLR